MYLALSILNIETEEYACFLIDRSPVFIGRDAVNTIVIDLPCVSQWHLALSFSERGITVRGMLSSTPTFLNGRLLPGDRPVTFQSRAYVSFARLRLLVEAGHTEMETRTLGGRVDELLRTTRRAGCV